MKPLKNTGLKQGLYFQPLNPNNIFVRYVIENTVDLLKFLEVYPDLKKFTTELKYFLENKRTIIFPEVYQDNLNGINIEAIASEDYAFDSEGFYRIRDKKKLTKTKFKR